MLDAQPPTVFCNKLQTLGIFYPEFIAAEILFFVTRVVVAKVVVFDDEKFGRRGFFADLFVAIKNGGGICKVRSSPLPIGNGFGQPTIIKIMVVITRAAKMNDINIFSGGI